MLQVRLLGQFDVRADGKRVVISMRAGQSLLAYLLLTARTAHRREKLAGLFWPDSSDDAARKNLRQELWRLRKALSASQTSAIEYLLTEELTVAFNPEADCWLDVAQLEQDRPAEDSLDERAQQAALYQGELLPGFYDEWIVLERERVQALFERRMQQLLERCIAEGRWTSTLEWSERWIALGHTPEPAYRALMVAYAALGDRANVAATYQRCVEALEKELAVVPSDETQALRDQLRQGAAVAQVNLSATQVAPRHSRVLDEPPAPGEPPFQGLEFFDEADADRFFGREGLTARLVERLRESQFLAVVIGASGSGKSSIVRAGLVPALKSGEPLADGALPPAGSREWRYEIITPTAHPLEALAVSLTRGSESVTAAATLLDDLRRDARSLRLFARRGLPGAKGRLLLVVDQFEELFTLCRDEFEREAFIDNLLAAVAPPPVAGDGQAEGVITLVITLRADFYAQLAQYPELRGAVAQQQEYIGPMTADELRRAIEEPARRGGWEFQPGVVDLMLRDVGNEPGALPLLSHALLETWQRRSGRTLTLKGYTDSGGVRGAIAQTAETVYQGLSPEQQRLARNIFLRLTELGEGTDDTRRRASLRELITRPELSAEVHTVLNTLAQARLITLSEGAAEVAHEALIREWPTLREWLAQDREGLRLHRHLTDAAYQWEALERDAGELYRGTRLAQALEWAEWSQGAEALNALEREFLQASKEFAEREVTDREAQRQRALEAAQDLAEAQRQRAEAQHQRAEAEKLRAEEQTRSSARLRLRNRVLTALGAAALVLAIVAGFFGVQAGQNSLQAQRQASLSLSRQLALEAKSRIGTREYDVAGLLSLEALRQADTVEARSVLLTALQNYVPIPSTLPGMHQNSMVVSFSPDGNVLAIGTEDGTIILWDPLAGRQIGLPLISPGSASLGYDPVTDMSFSPDGRILASGAWDGTITLWNIATHQPSGAPLKGPAGAPGTVLRFSPDGHTLVSGGPDFALRLWDVASRQPIGQPLIGHTDMLSQVLFSPDGRTVASSSLDRTIILWDVASRQPLGPPLKSGVDSGVNSLAYSHDGKRLASGTVDGAVIFWDLATRQPIGSPLTGHKRVVITLDFSPDDSTLVSGGEDGTLRLWDVASRQALGPPLAVHSGIVWCVAFSPDGKTVAAGYEVGVRLWDVTAYLPGHTSDVATDQALAQSLTGHTGDVTSLAFSAASATALASGDLDGHILLWNLATHQSISLSVTGHAGAVTSVAFSPDGKTLAAGGEDGTVSLWDVAAHQAQGPPLTGHTASVTSLFFSPDGKVLASGSRDSTVRLWDVATRQALGQPLAGPTFWVTSVAFSSDGKILASGSADGTIRLWDMSTRQLIGQPLTGDGTSLAFTPDGKILATAGIAGDIQLWDVASRQRIGLPLTGGGGGVFTLAISPDGKLLASGSQDSGIRLWDLATRQPLGQPMTRHIGPVKSVAFSPDGKTLASGGDDPTIWLWDVSLESWQARACTIAGRNLTRAEWEQYLPGQTYHKTCAQWPEGS